MTVKTETKALTKEKVLRTHACVIDTHKKSLEKNSHYFMTFLPGVEFDKNGNNEVQAICPHCSNILGVYPDAINGGENDSTIIDNRHCYDAYWEDKATKDDSLVRDVDDEDLPF